MDNQVSAYFTCLACGCRSICCRVFVSKPVFQSTCHAGYAWRCFRFQFWCSARAIDWAELDRSPDTCLVCGIAAVLLTWLSSGSGKRNNMNTIVLAGIMIGSLFTALVSLVKYVADTESQLPSITYWLMGSLNSANFDSLALGAPLIIIGIFVLFLIRWRLNILPLSEDEAKATGTQHPFFCVW